MRDRGKIKIKRASVEGKLKHSIWEKTQRRTQRKKFSLLDSTAAAGNMLRRKAGNSFLEQKVLNRFFCFLPFSVPES